MNAQATAGYLTDVPYSRNFQGECNPALFRLVAALNGFSPPRGEDFDYCDLGCGHGVTAATLAAAYPGSRFVGIDLNAEHVAFANGLAARGGLTNARFLERDIEGFGEGELQDFDFIAMHGVYSWIAPDKRRAAVDFAARRLKPGGLLYVSYNTLPGWAVIEPLRRLLVEYGSRVPGNSFERARAAVAYATFLRDQGAAYFADNPAARAMVDEIGRKDLRYVVHEYFHAHWSPMYFADVARELARGDLYYLGEIPLYRNFRDLTIPAPLAPLFEKIEDRLVFETQKDFATNEFFRRDIYVKGKAERSEDALRSYFAETPFGTLRSAAQVQRSIKLPHFTLAFEGALFDALVVALAERSARLDELVSLPSLAAFKPAHVADSLRNLAIGGDVQPARLARSSPAHTERFRIPSAYNRDALVRDRAQADPIVLASPVAGTGLIVPPLDALALRALQEAEPARRTDAVLAGAAGAGLLIGALSREEAETAVERMLGATPKLLQLGILEAADQ